MAHSPLPSAGSGDCHSRRSHQRDFWPKEALCLLLGCFCSLSAFQGTRLLAALEFVVPQVNHASEPVSAADRACLECIWGDVFSLLQSEQMNKNVLTTHRVFLRAAAC